MLYVLFGNVYTETLADVKKRQKFTSEKWNDAQQLGQLNIKHWTTKRGDRDTTMALSRVTEISDSKVESLTWQP